MVRYPACSEQIQLTDSEIAYLATPPYPVFDLARVKQCELQTGHSGPHQALAQAYGTGAAGAVWLQWSVAGPREIMTNIKRCRAIAPPPRDPDDLNECDLLAGHVGVHAFDLLQQPGNTPSPQMRERIEELLGPIDFGE
jgi:hypothetical protein